MNDYRASAEAVGNPSNGSATSKMWMIETAVFPLTGAWVEPIGGIMTNSTRGPADAVPEHEVGLGQGSRPVQERLAKTVAMVREVGPFAPSDHKGETDEMWGEE